MLIAVGLVNPNPEVIQQNATELEQNISGNHQALECISGHLFDTRGKNPGGQFYRKQYPLRAKRPKTRYRGTACQ